MPARECTIQVRLHEADLERWKHAAGEGQLSEFVREAVEAWIDREKEREMAALGRRVMALVEKVRAG